MKRNNIPWVIVSLLLATTLSQPAIGEDKAPLKNKLHASVGARKDVKIERVPVPERNPVWPHVVVLDLTDAEYQKFKADPLDFDKKHRLYPEQWMLSISACVELPAYAAAAVIEPKRWTVAIEHARPSTAACIAALQEKDSTAEEKREQKQKSNARSRK